MKIVIIGPAFPLRGGIADFNEALAKAFQAEGIDSSIYSFYFQYPSFLFPGTSQKSNGTKPEDVKIYSTISSVNPLSWYKTASLVKSENPDLVLIRYWLPFMAPALGKIASLLRKNNIRVIAITDNVIPHEKRVGDKKLTEYFVKNCDGFIAMSKSVLNDLDNFSDNNHKKFLPHPIYNIFGEKISKLEARKNLGVDVNERLILFFGFIRAYKGLGLLLDVMNQKEIKDRKIKLMVAGEFYENKLPYLDKINSGNVYLHSEYISKEKVKDYFCSADLVVQPYLHATQSGITQIAYHFGRPMLVTNVGGLSEIVINQRDGYVVEKNEGSITKAIVDFYDNKRELELSENVEEDRKRFTWKSFISGIKELYEEIK